MGFLRFDQRCGLAESFVRLDRLLQLNQLWSVLKLMPQFKCELVDPRLPFSENSLSGRSNFEGTPAGQRNRDG